MHDLEQFIDKKYCETRQRYETNCRGGNNLSASEEIQSSLNCSTKYVTFENLPFSSFYMDIDIQFNEDIYCGNCRESCREKSNKFLEHGFIKYPIDQIEFMREEGKEKNKIIDHLFTLKLLLCDEQNFSYMFSTTAAHRDHVLKKIMI